MLSVLLKIPAVIGIATLILLGIVLFLILIVLFVPITYKIRGHITEEEKAVSVKVHWLFGIIRFALDYTGQLTYQLKILWFDLTGLLKGKSKDTTVGEDGSKQEDIKPSGSAETPDVAGYSKNPEASDFTQTPESADNPYAAENPEGVENSDASAAPELTDTPKQSLSVKLHNIIFKIQSICAKIKEIRENISYYINLLKEDDTKHVISHVQNVIIKILKSIRPRRLKLDAIIGFDSPDTTGKVYGALCMLYPYYGDNIHIEPDFENKVLKGEVFCSGRIFICVLVINGLRILLDRKIFKIIHKFKNGGKRNGR